MYNKSDICPKCKIEFKDHRAKQCKKCREIEQQNERSVRRICQKCGGEKDKRAKFCLKCTYALTSCVCPICGSIKECRSNTCLDCYRKQEITYQQRQIVNCRICKNDLDRDLFYKSANGIVRQPCKACQKECARREHIKTLSCRYGLTEVEADFIASVDTAICAICGTEIKQFHIDHDHLTNKFRGLLCANCNLGIGFLNDNILILEKAIEYLKSPTYKVLVKDHFNYSIEDSKSLRVKKWLYNGIAKTGREWAKSLNITAGALYQKLSRGQSITDIIEQLQSQ